MWRELRGNLRVLRAETWSTVYRSFVVMTRRSEVFFPSDTRAVVYEIKKGVPQNGKVPPENDPGDDVLLDDIEK